MNLYILSDQVTNVTHAQFRLNEIGHPANWCQLATSEELTALGIITLQEVYPALEVHQYYDGTHVDDFTALTRTYNVGTYITPTAATVNAIVTTAVDYVASATDYFVMGTTEGTTITLQSAVTRYANLKSIPLVIKNTSTGNITVNVAVEGQTIEGSASVILTTLQSLSFVSDGFNYWLF